MRCINAATSNPLLDDLNWGEPFGEQSSVRALSEAWTITAYLR